jgi:hypothetical protein
MDNAFIFHSYNFNATTGVLHLRYAYENGAAFEETLAFPPPERPLAPAARAALEASFRLIFLLAGVSYYKAFAPTRLKCAAFRLDPATAAFVESVYRQGLGEFAFRNQINLAECVHFQSEEVPSPAKIRLHLPHRTLVPVGGGKDSIVTLEALKQAGENITLFALGGASGPAGPIAATIATAGLPALKIARTLSPNLLALNTAGALNGHIPITAILCSITIACAILYGFDTIALSNENSASAPNLRLNDGDINHQYSKSLAFEKDFAAYVAAHISPDIACFSFLRPLTEAEIARRFAKLSAYHAVFRSCNKAFKQESGARAKHWCCACPKCRFVFLALAPFMTAAKLIEIFGQNLLDDAAQQQGFAELCGLSAHKPFECVGEIEESALLLEKLATLDEWKEAAVVKALGRELAGQRKNFPAAYQALFTPRGEHRLPEKYVRILDANG